MRPSQTGNSDQETENHIKEESITPPESTFSLESLEPADPTVKPAAYLIRLPALIGKI